MADKWLRLSLVFVTVAAVLGIIRALIGAPVSSFSYGLACMNELVLAVIVLALKRRDDVR